MRRVKILLAIAGMSGGVVLHSHHVKESIMRRLNIALGSIMLIFFSTVAAEADDLVVGPIPFDSLSYLDKISCSGVNTASVVNTITVRLRDSAGASGPLDFVSCATPVNGTCSLTRQAMTIGRAHSPFSCEIKSANTPPASTAGSMCSFSGGARTCLEGHPAGDLEGRVTDLENPIVTDAVVGTSRFICSAGHSRVQVLLVLRAARRARRAIR
jgi:hypothetical protein